MVGSTLQDVGRFRRAPECSREGGEVRAMACGAGRSNGPERVPRAVREPLYLPYSYLPFSYLSSLSSATAAERRDQVQVGVRLFPRASASAFGIGKAWLNTSVFGSDAPPALSGK